jgi:hypothetical protein
VVTGITFKEGLDVTEVDQAAAWLNWKNTGFDDNSVRGR